MGPTKEPGGFLVELFQTSQRPSKKHKSTAIVGGKVSDPPVDESEQSQQAKLKLC